MYLFVRRIESWNLHLIILFFIMNFQIWTQPIAFLFSHCFYIFCITMVNQVLQYFGNVRHNLATLVAFAKVMKVTNHTRLWNAKLTWYFLSATYWICPYDSENDHSFRPTWPCQIVKVHATQAKFLEPWLYCDQLCLLCECFWLLL